MKFAAITASLLARKGDAAPSIVAPAMPPLRPALVPRDNASVPSELRQADNPSVASELRLANNPSVPSEPRQADNPEKLRRVMVCITPEELERLDIAAIKKGTKRHDIVRSALDDYFRKLSAQFPHPCACIEGHPDVPARPVNPIISLNRDQF